MTSTVITRAQALTRIGDAIADRTAFVVVAPPALADDVITRIAGTVPDGSWTGYIDSGGPTVLVTDDPRVPVVLQVLGTPIAAVILVPKTVPASQLTEALGRTVPDDGSQDLVFIHAEDTGPTIWPTLFVDAIGRVDPAVAAQLYASDIRSMS